MLLGEKMFLPLWCRSLLSDPLTPINAMIHVKWLILAAIICAWALVCRDDFKTSGYGTGFAAVGATLVAIILCLLWYIIFF